MEEEDTSTVLTLSGLDLPELESKLQVGTGRCVLILRYPSTETDVMLSWWLCVGVQGVCEA